MPAPSTTFLSSIDIGLAIAWTLVASFIVMLMPAGFALVETGLCRAKSAAHTMFMNFMIAFIAVAGFWICGFALMHGAMPVAALGGTPGLETMREVGLNLLGKTFGLFATKGFFLCGDVYNTGVFTLFFLQASFAVVATTIPTGAMAERLSLKGFYIYGLFMSMLLYPLFGNWAWGGGWLAQIGTNFGLGHGYVDFAGSGVVHALGGLCGLAGTLVLGPRIGKYGKNGRIHPMPAHHIPMALLGCFIVGFGWFGFTTGRALTMPGGLERLGIIAVVTLLAGAGGALAAWAYILFIGGKPDPTLVGNGLLAGLVAVSASAGFIGAPAGFLIGALAGLLVCWSVGYCDKLRIDDPVGAISIHATAGLWGVLAVGIFADGTATYGGTWNSVNGPVKGCLYGDWGQLGAQAIGCVELLLWGFGVSWVFWKIVDKLVGLRVLPEVEIQGLDVSETGVLGYPDGQMGSKE